MELDGIPQLWATKKFMDIALAGRLLYIKGRPFGVNSILLKKKNIVVVDIKPLKEKVEALRSKRT